jgi:DNA invertase Pin-like site-specific DNA recombinase
MPEIAPADPPQASVAEFERSLIVERVKAGLRNPVRKSRN